MSSVVALVKTTKVFTKMLKYLRLSNIEGANYPGLKNRYMRELLNHLSLQVETKNKPAAFPETAIFVANHISYLDIPLLMHEVPQVSLVSKKEVARWPVIGHAAKRVNTVFVNRGCKKSRQAVREAITQAILMDKRSIGVFPSGTTKMMKSPSWRRGAFEIAQAHSIPVIPVRLNYTPLRKAAYIDNDNFVLHLLAIMAGSSLRATVEFGDVCYIQNAAEDCAQIQRWCEAEMSEDLGVTATGDQALSSSSVVPSTSSVMETTVN